MQDLEDNSQHARTITIDGVTIVLMKIDKTFIPPKEGIKNLFAVDDKKNVIWSAELPSDLPYCYYNEVKYTEKKLLGWCGSMMYEIDLKTGKIMNSALVK